MRKKEMMPEESTEERILDAAFDVLQEKTLSGVRMALVAEKAGLFQSNIHYYYKSKHELLLAVQKKVLQHCIELRRALGGAEGTLENQLEAFWGQKKHFILEQPKYDYAEIEFWAQARVDEAVRDEIRASFSNWRQEIETMLGTFAAHLPDDKRHLLAAIMVSMMEGASLQYLAEPAAFDLDAYFDYCTELVLREVRA
ncbi:MAG: TetR/AcrR family transcriptional regulator [Butyricicoccus sp.]|nr:TetR/AcrR family transcriptional regulator [Butyricicoccus sp.]